MLRPALPTFEPAGTQITTNSNGGTTQVVITDFIDDRNVRRRAC